MSYVDAWFDRNNDVIKVVERNKKGEREFRDIPVRHTFYYKDARGKYLSIYGDALSKVVVKSTKELRKEQAINSGKQLFESDINPIFVTLSENYLNADAPKLNVAFFDIEVDLIQNEAIAHQMMRSCLLLLSLFTYNGWKLWYAWQFRQRH